MRRRPAAAFMPGSTVRPRRFLRDPRASSCCLIFLAKRLPCTTHTRAEPWWGWRSITAWRMSGGRPLKAWPSVFASDGGAASDIWLQIAADVIARPVQRIAHHPGSCLGAAYLAGCGAGLFTDFAGIARYVAGDRIFLPDPVRAQAYDRAYANFRDVYARLQTLYPRLDPATAPNEEATQ